MQDFMQTVTGKVIFIAILIVLMLIPIGLIMGIVNERQDRYQEAVAEVSQKWGGEQEITGPMMVIPYRASVQSVSARKTIIRDETRYAYFLPLNLDYKGSLDPELRKRGIFEVVLYSLDLKVKGVFDRPDFSAFDINESDIQWDRAFLVMGIPDTRGIAAQLPLTWNGRSLSFKPGTNSASMLANQLPPTESFDDFGRFVPTPKDTGLGRFSGVHTPLENLESVTQPISFSFDMTLKGSQSLRFWPIGKSTTVEVASDWQAPKFDGYFLPETNDNNDTFKDGFVANWAMSYYNRGYAQQWLSTDDQNVFNQIRDTAFGVKLILPVDFYQKNERAIKYAILFIGLTFLTFLGFEVLGVRVGIHFLQYLLVGFAMCVFYLLLLSFSEYIGFGMAYLVSSVATIGLITFYSFYILGAKNRAILVGLILGWIYVYLFTLLQLQDYALLLGSVMTFLILFAIMWLTRQIDWYALDITGTTPPKRKTKK